MSARSHVAIYRRLTRAYPRHFRHAYGEDLVAVFSTQLDQLGPWRCWARALRDLLVTVPRQHVEVPMRRRTGATITTGCLALSVGGTLAALVTGTSFYSVLLLLCVVAALSVAVRARRSATSALALERSSTWKVFFFSGAVLLALMVVLLNLPGAADRELSTVGWSVMMVVLLSGFTLLGAGIVLGAQQLQHRRIS